MGVSVTLNRAGLDALLAAWDTEIGHILDDTAAAILKDAQDKAPVKTGYMRDSGVVEPGADRWSRVIHFTAPYSAFIELGTRRMSARAYLLPAVEHHRAPFQDAFSALGKLHTL